MTAEQLVLALEVTSGVRSSDTLERARAMRTGQLMDAELGCAWAPPSGRTRPDLRVNLPVATDDDEAPPWAPAQRFPLHPLFELVAGSTLGERTHELARIAGVKRATISKWWERGGVRWERADQLAVALGTHPGVLWPEWWAAA